MSARAATLTTIQKHMFVSGFVSDQEGRTETVHSSIPISLGLDQGLLTFLKENGAVEIKVDMQTGRRAFATISQLAMIALLGIGIAALVGQMPSIGHAGGAVMLTSGLVLGVRLVYLFCFDTNDNTRPDRLP